MLDVEERSIVELNLDFPSVFSKVRAGEGSRRFGRSKSILETNQGTDLTDGGQYLHFFSIVKTKPSFFCLNTLIFDIITVKFCDLMNRNLKDFLLIFF